MSKYIFIIMLAFALTITVLPAEGGDNTAEIKSLKKEVADLRQEVNGLRALLERLIQAMPRGSKKDSIKKTGIKGDPFMGNVDAPLVLVEFSDYECPFCARFFRDTMPKIKKDYVNTGKLKYVFKDFPLSFHKKAFKAAEAAHCAGEKGKFWEMHDQIFANQQRMAITDLIGYAKNLGLNSKKFKKCLDDDRYAEGIKKDMAIGSSNRIDGTPSFILGRENKNGEVTGNMVTGALPYDVFKNAIETLLKNGGSVKR